MFVLNIIFYIFILVVIIQFFFYGIVFSKFANAKLVKNNQKNISVSVIICAKNEAQNLKAFLPNILSQSYPIFEVVLINDGSIDDTLAVMKSFKKKYPNIKIVNVEPNESFWGNKKYALTLGIKAASHNYLLFTDADCIPKSKYWIKEMSSSFSNQHNIVLGYGAYKKLKSSMLNKLIRYETLLTAIQYFSYAKLGIPYMGVGRNLAYRKDLFFDTKGFMKHMNIKSGDDDLFINQIANSNNTAICFSKDSFTESLPKQTFKDWITQKRRHVSTSVHYKFKHKIMLGSFYVSQILFWLFSITLLTFSFHWQLVLTLLLTRFIIQYVHMGRSARKLNEVDTILWLPLLEVFLILSQLYIFIYNIISKPNHWK